MEDNGRSVALSSTAPDMDTSDWTALLRVSGEYNLRMARKLLNHLSHELQVFIVVVICVEEGQVSPSGGCGGNMLSYSSNNFSDLGSLTLAFGACALGTDRCTKIFMHHGDHKVPCGLFESTELVLGDLQIHLCVFGNLVCPGGKVQFGYQVLDTGYLAGTISNFNSKDFDAIVGYLWWQSKDNTCNTQKHRNKIELHDGFDIVVKQDVRVNGPL